MIAWFGLRDCLSPEEVSYMETELEGVIAAPLRRNPASADTTRAARSTDQNDITGPLVEIQHPKLDTTHTRDFKPTSVPGNGGVS